MSIDRIVSVHPVRPVRRPVGTCDPDVVAVHERIVAAHEGARRFLVESAKHRPGWHEIAAEVDGLLDEAQGLIEALR